MLIKIPLIIIAVLSFLYIFWKRLREDYVASQIFTVAFYILFGLVIGGVGAHYYLPKFTFWISFMGAVIGLWIGVTRYRLRIFETIEAAVAGALLILASVHIIELLEELNMISGIWEGVVIALIILYYLLGKHYKKFTWYASGRVGFAGMSVIGIYFIIRCLIALALSDMVSFENSLEIMLSGLVAFASFFAAYNLAGKTT